MERRYDFLVIGSGIAGLFYTLEVAARNPSAKLAIVTKKGEKDTNTNRAQGGIAAVLGKADSVEGHVNDTLKAGGGLCHRDVVERVVESGPSVIEELIAYGVKFTRVKGRFDLGREGGHSASRVVHAADLTGLEIERALVAACHAKPGQIDIYQDHIILDLITYPADGREVCAGAFVFSELGRAFDAFYAPVTMLATGGLGQVYFHTTNPKIATGDGVAMAYRAGVSAANLEFVQFHPTTLYNPGRWPFLISEALDVSHVDGERIKQRFPNIYRECLRRGFDITQRSIPVVPSAHYACGGVLSTIEGETELPGLFVAGEVAMTGMHGANRLASNSLLEAVVMAKYAAEKSTEYFKQAGLPEVIPVDNSLYSSLRYPREKVLTAHDRRQLQRVMSDFVAIVRTEDRLNLALEKVHRIKDAIERYYLATPATYGVIELRNMATVAELIIKSALMRCESRGLHYIEDYPETDDAYLKDTVIEGKLRQRSESGQAS
jgi:L-aspartate oxidase